MPDAPMRVTGVPEFPDNVFGLDQNIRRWSGMSAVQDGNALMEAEPPWRLGRAS